MLVGIQGPPEGLQAEALDEFSFATRRGRGARDQAMQITTTKSARGKFLSGRAVRLIKDRRHTERLILVLETIRKILLRKLSSRRRLVA